jgi:hypothetical protein
MRRLLIRGGVAVVLLPVLWYFTAHLCALAVDQVYTPRLAILTDAPIGWRLAADDTGVFEWRSTMAGSF